MSDETTAVESPIATPEAPVNRTEQLIQKHAKAAALAMNQEPEAAEPATSEKPRGPDGKFLPEKKAAKPKEKPNAKPEEPRGTDAPRLDEKQPTAGKDGKGEPGESAEVPEFTGSLGKVKRLFREGKTEEAFKILDLDPKRVPNGMWVALRKESARREAEVLAAHQAVETKHEALRQEARQLVDQLRPFADAKAAIEAGDDEKAFQLLWGKDVNTWQREQLAKMHRGDLRKDPAVAELTKRLEAERLEREKLAKALEERDQTAAKRAEEAAIEARRVEYRKELTEQLADADDERIRHAASLPWFVKAVHDEQLKSYKFDPTTKHEDYLTVEEAIERVYDPERLTAAQWQQLQAGMPAEKRDPGSRTQVATDRRANDVKRVKAPTTLSRSDAADAVTHVKPAPGSRELVDYYARLAARKANA